MPKTRSGFQSSFPNCQLKIPANSVAFCCIRARLPIVERDCRDFIHLGNQQAVHRHVKRFQVRLARVARFNADSDRLLQGIARQFGVVHFIAHGQTIRRYSHSVRQSEQARWRLPPSPSGRNTANCGLLPHRGHSGSEYSEGKVSREASDSACAWKSTRAKNVAGA